jgi:VanZ family protein
MTKDPRPPGPTLIRRLTSRPTRRAAFWLYMLALALATYWPDLRIDVPEVKRPDLFLHAAAFGLWTALLLATGYLGPLTSRRNLCLGTLIGAVHAIANEAAQALPFVRRTAAVDDALANLAGVAIVCTAWAIASAVSRRRSPPGTSPP